jgi:class 3 adenylate cyclase
VGVCPQCGAALPADARFCPSCAAPAEWRQEPAEERKLATVVFADLVGSTALGGSQDPERTRVLLDRFYDAMAAEIEQVGGTVEKFVGDAVMAAFGAPAALEDHAERALHASLAMQRRLAELFGDQLALRIGVNTGEVVVGRAREGSSFVTGDAVNVGARLEQAAAPGEILVGERTAAAVRGAFELDEPRTLEAKGKPDGVVARRLVRALSLMRPRGVGGLCPAFIGRENELADLRGAYEGVVREGRPRLVAIMGDAGVGKSRLVRELWEWLADQRPQPLQRTGRCLSYGRGIGYWPLAEVLREHFDIRDSDAPEVAAKRLGERRYLGLTLGLGIAPGLHPLVARERLHDSWAEFLGELVAERPTVVLIEDAHWADDDLLDLIDSLVTQVEGPLLLLATARPELLERRAEWTRHALELDALSPATAGALLDELIGARLPAPLRETVIERAEGNPFFVEELIATLIDRGVLARRNGGWRCGELPEGFEVPDTVQAVLAARIDLLPAAEKEALQAASVIGRIFWTGPVYELVGGMPDLDLLAEREFIRRRAGSSIAGEREYAIKHALTREVAYESLPKARRAQLHAAFAGWLERVGEGSDEYASLLAHHYAEAVRPEDLDLAWSDREVEAGKLRAKAVEWSRRAARLAIGRYEIDEGIALLHQAVALESDSAKQADVWLEIGRANAFRFDGEGFRTAIEQAIDLTGPSAELYAELALQTARRSGMWKRPPDREVVDEWIDRALELAEEDSPIHARALAAVALWRKDEGAARSLHAIAQRLGDVELRSNALAALTDVAWSAGDLEQASTWLGDRLELLPQLVDPDDRHFALMTAMSLHLARGRLSEANRASELLDEMVQGLTPHHRLHGMHSRLLIRMICGRWDDLRALAPHAELAVEANSAAPCPSNASCLLYCALANLNCGDETEASRLEAEAAVQILDHYRSFYWGLKLRLALARDDLSAVERLVDAVDFRPRLDRSTAGIDRVRLDDGAAAFLDALVALGARERIESEALQWVNSRNYVQPFALRALGAARADERLLDEATMRFRAIGLDWRAEETLNMRNRARKGGP